MKEKDVLDRLKSLGRNTIPMKLLFPDACFKSVPWTSRFDSVFPTYRHWELLCDYIDGKRWLFLSDDDKAIFDYWLIDWFDYAKWVATSRRPDMMLRYIKMDQDSKYKVLDTDLTLFLGSSVDIRSWENTSTWDRVWLHMRSQQCGLESDRNRWDNEENTTINLTKPRAWILPEVPFKTDIEKYWLEFNQREKHGYCVRCGDPIRENDATQMHPVRWSKWCQKCSRVWFPNPGNRDPPDDTVYSERIFD